MNHLTAKAPYVLQHKRAVLRWIESHKGTISMGTLYGWLIYPVCEEVTAWEAQGEASSPVGLDSGRGSQVHKPPSSPGWCQLSCDTAGQSILGHRFCSRVLTATLTPMGVCCDLQHPSVSAYWVFQSYLGHRVALVALAWKLSRAAASLSASGFNRAGMQILHQFPPVAWLGVRCPSSHCL